ncbi:right-handed parallel beta-helix repeat-containing protein [Planctomycetota bacterium]
MKDNCLRTYISTFLVLISCGWVNTAATRATLIAGTGSIFEGVGDGAAVLRLMENGDWVKICSDTGIRPDIRIIHCLYNFKDNLFAGTDKGAVFLYSGGTQWIQTGHHSNAIPSNYGVLSLVSYQDQLYAGTQPAGLFRYDLANNQWLKVQTNLFVMQGLAALYTWTDPLTQVDSLFAGDVLHDMILRWDPGSDFSHKELSFLASEGGSCIWDFESYHDRLYAASYQGRIYVRSEKPASGGTHWELATPLKRHFHETWELEVFQGDLYAGSDNVLEWVRPEISEANDLKLESLYALDEGLYQQERIVAMIAADQIYLGTTRGTVYSYDGSSLPKILGSTLPDLTTLTFTDIFPEHPKVNNFCQSLDGCVAYGETPLTFHITYSLTGSSANVIQIVDYLPDGFAFLEASPPPDETDGFRLTWDVNSMDGEIHAGLITLTLQPDASVIRGHEIPTRCSLYDGQVPFWHYQQTWLYDVPCLYVDADADPNFPCDGLSWDTAFSTLGDALNLASQSSVQEIWVAQGYYSVPNVLQDGTPIDSFYVPEGLGIYGGFAGNESERSQRLPDDHPVFLESTKAFGEGIMIVGRSGEVPPPNCNSCQENTVLDGFTLQPNHSLIVTDAINADTTRTGTSLVVRNCTIQNCTNGLFLTDGSSALLEDTTIIHSKTGISSANDNAILEASNCRFVDNDLAVFLGQEMTAQFTNCEFLGNGTRLKAEASFAGGITAHCTNLRLDSCRLSDNRAANGGALLVNNSDTSESCRVDIVGCEFAGNTAYRITDKEEGLPSGQGGAIYITNAEMCIDHCWFVGNAAVRAGGSVACNQSNGCIHQCLFAQNLAVEALESHGGAIFFNNNRGDMVVFRSAFLDNQGGYGGAIVTHANAQQPTRLINCTFRHNQALKWAGGALSITGSVTPFQTTGGAAELTNCLLYGNTGQVEGSAIEIYSDGTLTLDTSALDGHWLTEAYIWIQDSREPAGRIIVPDSSTMMRLKASPFRTTHPTDFHLYATADVNDRGRLLSLNLPLEDPDNDAPLTGRPWDIGTDEINPNHFESPWLYPESLVFIGEWTRVVLQFNGAQLVPQEPEKTDQVALYKLNGDPETPVLSLPLHSNNSSVNLLTTEPNGISSGSVTLRPRSSGLTSGLYTAKLLGPEPEHEVKAESYPFIIYIPYTASNQ